METTRVESILQDLCLDLGRDAASVWDSHPPDLPKVEYVRCPTRSLRQLIPIFRPLRAKTFYRMSTARCAVSWRQAYWTHGRLTTNGQALEGFGTKSIS